MRSTFTLLLVFSVMNLVAQPTLKDAENYLLFRNYSKAANICTTILDSEPDRDDAKLVLGMAYQGMQNYQSALEAYNSYSNSEETTLQYLKAECFETLSDINSAIDIYKGILEKDSTDMHATRNIARIYLKLKNYEKAKLYYSSLIEEYPENYLFQKNMGICNYQLSEEFPAMRNFNKAWELNKKDLELPINIANIFARIQQPHMALRILAEGLKYDSTNIQIIKTSAFICYKLERYDTAAYQFNRIIALGDSSQFTRKYLGISHFNNLNYDGAVEHLKQAYSLDTLDTETTYYLGLALTTMHGKQEGIEFLQKTLDLMTPDSAFFGSVYASIGRAWTDINEREKSISYYAKAIQYDPSQPIYIYEKAKMHDQLGAINGSRDQYNSALREYEKFLDLQLAAMEEIMISRGLDKDQVSAPGMDYSRERIKKIKNELFFLGKE